MHIVAKCTQTQDSRYKKGSELLVFFPTACSADRAWIWSLQLAPCSSKENWRKDVNLGNESGKKCGVEGDEEEEPGYKI